MKGASVLGMAIPLAVGKAAKGKRMADSEGDDSEEYKSAVDDFMDAVAEGDKEGARLALKFAIKACMAGGEDEEEGEY